MKKNSNLSINSPSRYIKSNYIFPKATSSVTSPLGQISEVDLSLKDSGLNSSINDSFNPSAFFSKNSVTAYGHLNLRQTQSVSAADPFLFKDFKKGSFCAPTLAYTFDNPWESSIQNSKNKILSRKGTWTQKIAPTAPKSFARTRRNSICRSGSKAPSANSVAVKRQKQLSVQGLASSTTSASAFSDINEVTFRKATTLQNFSGAIAALDSQNQYSRKESYCTQYNNSINYNSSLNYANLNEQAEILRVGNIWLLAKPHLYKCNFRIYQIKSTV